MVLRIRGQPPVAIGAGDTWIPERTAGGIGLRERCASGSAPTTRDYEHRRERAHVTRSASTERAASHVIAIRATVEPESSVDFRAAMAALDVGDNAQAAAAFASFLAKHPRDPRAEDAAYLRVIALQRSGDGGSMRWAAQEYLRRYPEGFRQAEMEALSR